VNASELRTRFLGFLVRFVQNTMAFSVVMPALEMAQETGKLVAWRKKEGESVVKGEPLIEIETDKAVLEVESPADGVLAGISALEGTVVPVGKTIAWIIRPGESVPLEVTPNTSERQITKPPIHPVPVASTLPSVSAATAAQISPKARRLAKEHGVDVARVHGSGPGGEILASDVLAAAKSAPAPPPVETLGTIGRLMAERTTQSWTSVPHFFVVREVDASRLVAAREHAKSTMEQAGAAPLTYTDFLVALAAPLLAKHSRVNASWVDGKIHSNAEVNIAVAMAVDGGVVAPVIHNANTAKLGEIAVQRQALTERARAGRLRPDDIANATFTISNLGMYHVDAFSAIISPPQAAILAVGSIQDRVIPVAGQPAIRPMMTLTLSCDHRVIDGAGAALFLDDLVEALREPEQRPR
jgi:pyruvate dehydrogenase E2 component (dihydrolipoamide acetyltransferase)